MLLLRRLLAPPQQDLAETLAWARSDLAASPSLDDLVAHSGVSKPVFLAHFRAATGTSQMKMLAERRVEEAKRRLREGEDRVRQIGRSCGFRSDTAIREMFRQHTDLSPKQYRQQHRRSLPAK